MQVVKQIFDIAKEEIKQNYDAVVQQIRHYACLLDQQDKIEKAAQTLADGTNHNSSNASVSERKKRLKQAMNEWVLTCPDPTSSYIVSLCKGTPLSIVLNEQVSFTALKQDYPLIWDETLKLIEKCMEADAGLSIISHASDNDVDGDLPQADKKYTTTFEFKIYPGRDFSSDCLPEALKTAFEEHKAATPSTGAPQPVGQ